MNFQQMAFPSPCRQEADYVFVKYFKTEYEAVHINSV